jgi:hypothetical protein
LLAILQNFRKKSRLIPVQRPEAYYRITLLQAVGITPKITGADMAVNQGQTRSNAEEEILLYC